MLRWLRVLALSTILTLSVVGAVTPAGAATFGANDLVIYRVGNGTGALGSSATPVFLDEFTQAGGAPVQSIAMPTTGSGSNRTLTASGSATSEGELTLSADGNYLMLTGYDAPVGTASVAGTASATTNRVVGRVDGTGNVDTTTALSDFSTGNNPRSATSPNGTDIWVAGAAGGIRYTTFGTVGTSTQLNSTLVNFRQVNIVNSQLYASDSSGSTNRLNTIGSGLPTTAGQTITNLPGFETNTGSPYSFAFFDLTNTVAGLDTLYVADDAAGIQKWSLVGGTWTLNGTIVPKSPTGANDFTRGLIGTASSPPAGGQLVTLFSTSPGFLHKVTDPTGYNSAPSATDSTIATAGTNMAFRGVAFAPTAQTPPDTPEVPWAVALPLTGFGLVGLGLVFETRRRRRLAA